MEPYDVVIVGGGCAGSTAAFFIGELRPDMSILLIDRLEGKNFDRYHRMCGEAISEDAFRRLRPLKAEHVIHDIDRVEERWPGGAAMEIPHKGYIVDRPRLLRSIQRRYLARGGMIERDALLSVQSWNGRHHLELSSGRTIEAMHLIGADGFSSRVRRDIFGSEPSEVIWMEQYVVDKELPPNKITFLEGEMYEGGYRWEFPSGRYARIGFPRGTDVVGEEVVEKHRRAIPIGSLERITHGRCYLVGDAAAMPNPLKFGGIRTAMLSGRKAAEAISMDEPGRYEDWWHSSLYSHPSFMRSFRRFSTMNDEAFAEVFGMFGRVPLPLSFLASMVRYPRYRDIYLAFIRAALVAW